MTNSDKIIPFKQITHREKSEFRLKTEISIYICRNVDKYIIDCASSNKDDTVEDIINILKKILSRIAINEIYEIEIKEVDYYELSFTLLYYESNNKHNWKYICLPQNIQLEKLAEYLYTFISIYEYKKSLH